jgi:hypothetical protein
LVPALDDIGNPTGKPTSKAGKQTQKVTEVENVTVGKEQVSLKEFVETLWKEDMLRA